MQLIYQAKNSVEAHLILNLFEQAGLTARIDGEYLQGGMGELQVSGIVRVMIVEDDYEQGKEIIRQWEAKEDIDFKVNSNPSVLKNKPKNSYLTFKWKYFIPITIVSLVASILLYIIIPIFNSGCFTGSTPFNRANINKTTIIGVTEEVHKLLSIEFSKNKSNILGTHLDQVGLVDGNKIIIDFVKNEEVGVALDHLNYMLDALEENNVQTPEETSKKIKNMRTKLKTLVENNN